MKLYEVGYATIDEEYGYSWCALYKTLDGNKALNKQEELQAPLRGAWRDSIIIKVFELDNDLTGLE